MDTTEYQQSFTEVDNNLGCSQTLDKITSNIHTSSNKYIGKKRKNPQAKFYYTTDVKIAKYNLNRFSRICKSNPSPSNITKLKQCKKKS